MNIHTHREQDTCDACWDEATIAATAAEREKIRDRLTASIEAATWSENALLRKWWVAEMSAIIDGDGLLVVKEAGDE